MQTVPHTITSLSPVKTIFVVFIAVLGVVGVGKTVILKVPGYNSLISMKFTKFMYSSLSIEL